MHGYSDEDVLVKFRDQVEPVSCKLDELEIFDASTQQGVSGGAQGARADPGAETPIPDGF